jgi:4-hydroxy-3-methylbut-2-enyl diphosphate reductase
VVIIAGSAHSSNACRLLEIAENQGAKAFRIDNAEELPEAELAKCELVGLSSGASTPESVLEKIIARLQKMGFSA